MNWQNPISLIVLAMTGLLVWYGSAVAKVVRFEITRTDIYGSFVPGDFVRIDGRIVGELAHDEPIPGLDKAMKNAALPNANPSFRKGLSETGFVDRRGHETIWRQHE